MIREMRGAYVYVGNIDRRVMLHETREETDRASLKVEYYFIATIKNI